MSRRGESDGLPGPRGGDLDFGEVIRILVDESGEPKPITADTVAKLRSVGRKNVAARRQRHQDIIHAALAERRKR